MSDIESHQVILKEEVEVKAHHFPVSLCSAKASAFNQHTVHKALDLICQIKSVCDNTLVLLLSNGHCSRNLIVRLDTTLHI